MNNTVEAPTKGLVKYTYFVRCMVRGCSSPKDVKYHSFPKEPNTRRKWIVACSNVESYNPDRSLVCGRHFVYTDYFGCYEGDVKRFPLGIRLKQGVIPHCEVPSKNMDSRDPEVEVLHRKRIVEEAILEYESGQKKQALQIVPLQTNDKESGNIDLRPAKKRSKFELYISNLSSSSYPSIIREDDKSLREKESILLKKTIKTLRTRVRMLETKVSSVSNTKAAYRKKLRRLQSLKGRREIVYEELGKTLSHSQIRYLMEPHSHQRDHSREEILRALILRLISPTALNYVKSWKLANLPSIGVQDQFLQKFKFPRGIHHESIQGIRKDFLEDPLRSPNKNLAILSIAEASLNLPMASSAPEKKAPYKSLTLATVRGLVSDFKKIVYQDFDSQLNKELLFCIIKELEKNGIQVIGINFNLRAGSLFKELGLSQENTIIVNPTDSNRHILIFPDVPNLLVTLRDHILEEECLFPDDEGDNLYQLGKDVFKELIGSTSSKNISLRHIRLRGEDRRSTTLAAELLSESTAASLISHFENDGDPRGSAVSIIGSWYSIMSSRDNESALGGVNEEVQLKVLNDMERLIYGMQLRGSSRPELSLFQQGILISIMSTKILYQSIVKEEAFVDTVQTARLNQEPLQTVFNHVRAFEESFKSSGLRHIDALSLVKLILAEHQELREDERIPPGEASSLNEEDESQNPSSSALGPPNVSHFEIIDVKKELIKETICEFDIKIASHREEIIDS